VKDTATEMLGGSRVNHIFYELFTKEILRIDPFDALSDDDIKTAIRNAQSLRPNLFIPEVAFETLSKQQIWRLQGPAL
jgi:dynamin 1-like protein